MTREWYHCGNPLVCNSSDTWAPEIGFACFDLDNNPVPQTQCAFGTSGFDVNGSSTFVADPDTNFNIEYGDGEFLTGTVGFDTVTVGNMVVAKQEIGIVTNAAWEGDGFNTGLMGLASPNLTSVFRGTDPDDDEFPQTQIPYNPVFYSAVQQGVVSNPCKWSWFPAFPGHRNGLYKGYFCFSGFSLLCSA